MPIQWRETLPEEHKGRTLGEIYRAEGWALHKIVPEFLKVRKPEDNLDRALGICSLKEMVFNYKFSSDIEIEVKQEGDSTHGEYHTPIRNGSTSTEYTNEMRKPGASLTLIDERSSKSLEMIYNLGLC